MYKHINKFYNSKLIEKYYLQGVKCTHLALNGDFYKSICTYN